ncbi:putative protein-disulfide isomerase [Paenibacillus sp. CF384]|nr:putative protein-disulfide isomerase [Paenibacillus sp. CF384]
MKVISGGLFVGNRIQPIQQYPHIPEANKRISQLTGVEFGEAYDGLLQEGTFVMDSDAAAVGFAALRSLSPERAVYLASAMQHAFYHEGRSLSDPSTYQEIAWNQGLDGNEMLHRLDDPAIHAEARADYIKAGQLGAKSFPTLLVQTESEIIQLGIGSATLHGIEKQLTEVMARIESY